MIESLAGIRAVYSFLRNFWLCLPNIIRFLIFANFAVVCMLAFYRSIANK